MGMFVSLCPHCEMKITWFLEPPKNYFCKKCNKPVSEKEIEESWLKVYEEYLESRSSK